MRIVLASSEAVPFSKTGGLADVSGALAKALAALGHSVTLIVPHYPREQAKRGAEPRDLNGPGFTVSLGGKNVVGRVGWGSLDAGGGADDPAADVTVLFVDQPAYFDRPALYGDADGDYGDNAERFTFFSRAVLEVCRLLVLRPDVIHCNDWQTGLIPAMLAEQYRGTPGFEHTGSLFTVHNLAYQGSFPHWDFHLTGLDWGLFNFTQAEHFGRLNLLKTGIVTADRVTTVSPTYAREITTALGGCGLDAVLAARGDDLAGVLNGIDPTEWNPAVDPHLPVNYTAETVVDRKPLCRDALRHEMGLSTNEPGPLFGMVSRMVDQKGFDLIGGCAEGLAASGAQFCFLGTGDPRYESLVKHLTNLHAGRFAARVGFDEGLAHRIEAGCDAYLMPSLYEPCGLNQMYSLAYGTVPVVRRVGGLADTVTDLTKKTLKAGTATGFVFDEYDAGDLLAAVHRAVECYREEPERWRGLMRAGMAQDHSWSASARQYARLYRAAADEHRA